MTGSLRLRLLLSLAAILVCGTLVQGFVVYRGARLAADAQFDYQMEQIALSMAYGVAERPAAQSPRLAADIRNFDFIVQVWSAAGVRVLASEPRILIAPDTPPGLSDWRGDDGHYRMVTIREPGRVIQVAQDRSIRARSAGRFARRAVLPIALWAPLLLVVGLWLLNQALRPLDRVREQVAARRPDDLSPIDASALPDEFRPVIVEFNDLLQRLQRAFEAQGRFVADAAHELRTPLSALTLQVQSLSRQVGATPASAAIETLSSGIARTSRLVEQMLVLAREDHQAQSQAGRPNTGAGAGADAAATPPVDLAAIARDTVGDLADLAARRDHDLGLARDDAVRIPGDADAIRILVRNLVDNAIKYTPAGGRIDVSVSGERAAGIGRLVVEDSGPGVPEAERPALFDRFRRLPGRATDESGSGLGLAIVRSIADRHRAAVAVDASPSLGGLRVTVDFPARPAAKAAT